jgi:L-rhamnose mutarotase
MKTVAFKMHILDGFEAEYKKRHDEIWPELKQLLKSSGINEYHIFLDETSNDLFAVLTIIDAETFNTLPASSIMQKWWLYMKDIMDSNPDNSPVSVPLREVFYLP